MWRGGGEGGGGGGVELLLGGGFGGVWMSIFLRWRCFEDLISFF